MAKLRDLYLAADDGLYKARINGGVATAEKVGLGGTGRVRSVMIDAKAPERVYAATNEQGVFRSDDAGRNWATKNKNIVYLEGWSLAQEPDSGVIYHGTGPVSIYRSEDQGETWEDLKALKAMSEMVDWTFPMAPFVPHARHISISPNSPSTILSAVEEGWIIRSDDAGRTWRNLKDGAEFDAHTIVALPGGSDVLMSSGKGVFRSDDDGAHFQPANDGITRKYMAHVAYHLDRPDRLFTAGAEGYPGLWRKRPEGAMSQFYRSLDAGRSWQRLTEGVPDHLHGAARAVSVAPDDPDTVFVGLTDGTVWLSENGGDSFEQVAQGATAILGMAPAPIA